MNKTFLILVSAILLIGMVSASPLSDLMSDSVTNLHVTIGPHDTTVNFLLNMEGYEWDELNIPIEEVGEISLDLSKVLSGINFNANYKDGETAVFSNFEISEESTILFNGAEIPFESALLIALKQQGLIDKNLTEINAEVLTDLASQGEVAVGDYSFVKNGNNYIITYNKGFQDVPSELPSEEEAKAYILEQINEAIYVFNVEKLIENYILPEVGMDSIPSLNPFDYEAVFEEASFDLGGLKFADGDYTLSATVSIGEEEISKSMILTLYGTEINYVVPTTDLASEYVSEIKNLPFGTVVTLNVLDTTIATNGTSLTNLNPLKVIEITLSSSTDGDIYFSIDQSLVSNPNKISLYVLEGTTWTKLTTTYLGIVGTEYTYSAHTPHFSTFMIGEDTTITSSSSHHHHPSSSSSEDSSDETESTDTTSKEGEKEEKTKPEEKKNTFTSFLTGAVTGIGDFVSSGAGIISLLTLLIAVVGLTVIVKLRR